MVATKIVFINYHIKDDIKKWYFYIWPFIKHKILVITNPTESLKIYLRRKKHKSKITFAYLGRLSYRKGLDILTKAWKLLEKKQLFENIELWFIGDGELRKDLENKLNYNNVKFFGKVSDRELKKLLKLVDCGIFPAKHEGYNLPLREFIFNGIPVICSDIYPHKQALSENYPLFFESENPEDLAKKIIDFFEKYRDINVSKYIKEKPKTVEEWIKEWKNLVNKVLKEV